MKIIPLSPGGVQGWVVPKRKDPARRLRLLPLPRGDLGENAADDVAMHIGQAHVSATETVGEFLMIQSEKLEDGGMEIEYFRDVFHRMHADFVGRAVDKTALQAPACHPDGEGCLMVVPTVRLGGMGGPAELRRPNHESLP